MNISLYTHKKSFSFLRSFSTLEHIFYSYVRIIAKIDDLNNVAVF